MTSPWETARGFLPTTAAVNAQDHLTIGGCDVLDLAREFGSPLYVYSRDALSSRADELLGLDSPGGLTVRYAVKANPSLVPTNAFVENMFPALANNYIPGSASANYFYGIYGNNAGSDLDLRRQLG